MKLTLERRTELMNELRLRVLFRDKCLCRRYGVSRSTLAILQREAFKQPMAAESHVLWFLRASTQDSGSRVRAKRLSPERRAELFNVIRLRALFRDKALRRRYGVARSTLARLRREAKALDEMAQNVYGPRAARRSKVGTCTVQVTVLNSERGVNAA